MLPPREPASLPVVTVVGQEHLGTDEENLPVEADYAAVVSHALEHNGHAEVAQHVVRAPAPVWFDFSHSVSVVGDWRRHFVASACVSSWMTENVHACAIALIARVEMENK
jgi:hypothetical protein